VHVLCGADRLGRCLLAHSKGYSPSGVAKYMVKDLDFASAVAAATGTHPVLLPAVKAAFEELTALGHGDSDIAVTRRYIEQRCVDLYVEASH
jgi:3-hydroxyisobutyrate dehydrogenase-like beta-hydroxyacid dehydrogenase